MKKILIAIVVLTLISVATLSGCNERTPIQPPIQPPIKPPVQPVIKDSDNDGHLDNADAFPYDKNEWKDSDNDGVGDNADAFPYDATEQKDSDRDKVGDNADAFPNNPQEQYDSDTDGVGNNADKFPYDSTQSVDRDGDGYGDNPYGNNADAFPDNPAEWKDSDHDSIGDNADIYDSGNGGIQVIITKYQGDYYGDEWDETDPYFKITIDEYNSGTGVWTQSNFAQSTVWENTNIVYSPLSLTADVRDDTTKVMVRIEAWDDDFWTADEMMDISSGAGYELRILFHPHQTAYATFSEDGRLDLLDEMDGIIDGYIQIVKM